MVVYPRWRGELAKPVDLDTGRSGLSPLPRGTLAAILSFNLS